MTLHGDPSQLLDGTSYRYIAELGAGAMGQVIEAEHVHLGTRVVVKLLHNQIVEGTSNAERARAEDRMRLEAQVLSRLEHPNLLKVSDYGVTKGGRAFLVSERLVGRTLGAELEARKFLPVPEAIAIACQILGGLAVAHGAGLIHRDIKPDNIFVCGVRDGLPFIKVLDFGLAKVVDAQRDPRTPQALQLPTDDGMALGTPRYMSPEQAAGRRDVDHRADIYCLGTVLYTMVAGRTPFEHVRGIVELLTAQHNEEPAPPSRYAQQPIPADLDRAILKSLAKSPAARFQTPRELAEELVRIVREGERQEEPARASPAIQNRWDSTQPIQNLFNRGKRSATAPMVSEGETKALTARGTVRLSDSAAAKTATAKGTVMMGDDPALHDAGRAYRESLRESVPSPSPAGLPGTVELTAAERASAMAFQSPLPGTVELTAMDRVSALPLRSAPPPPAAPAGMPRGQLIAMVVIVAMALVGIALIAAFAFE